jgi:ubiquinone/menaquinone biosynthesis C-methylase UbiE
MEKGFSRPPEKDSLVYLEQISRFDEEKFGLIARLAEDRKLPAVNGIINILEMGTGGGESAKKLHDKLSGNNDIKIFGLDNVHGFAQLFSEKTGSSAVAADAGRMPFKDDSLSAINASAVFHEISSYGVDNGSGNKIFGLDAVRSCLKEADRTLCPDGVLMYCDVFCPDNKGALKSVIYRQLAWRSFVKKFLQSFEPVITNIFPDAYKNLSMNHRSEEIEIRATTQIHREIQRHYITFRDYFRKVAAPDMGLKVDSEFWLDKDAGNKRHDLILSGVALEEYSRINKDEKHTNGRPLAITLESDKYDDLTDRVITKAPPQLTESWFKREGGEIYTYASSDEMLKFCADLSTLSSVDGKSYNLKPVRNPTIIPRAYYMRYLRRVIDNPEIEAKQSICLIKSEKQ